MKPLNFFSLLLGLLIPLSGCQEAFVAAYGHDVPPCPDTSCFFIDGKLSQSHVDGVLERAEGLDVVIVRSIGGRIGYAREIASVIFENDVDVVILDECSSACFDFLVLAAKSVTALNEPIVAIHGNPITTNILLEREGHFHLAHCHWPSLAFVKNLQAHQGISADYNREVLRRLGEIKIEFTTYDDGCLSSFTMQPEIEYWEPSRNEIKRFTGIEIVGEICADRRATCL